MRVGLQAHSLGLKVPKKGPSRRIKHISTFVLATLIAWLSVATGEDVNFDRSCFFSDHHHVQEA